MIRTPNELIATYEAETAEQDGLQAHEDLIQLMAQPGWVHFLEWLSARRDSAFQQLRRVQGPAQAIADSFHKWQAIDGLYEDIQDYIKLTIEHGSDIQRRQRDQLTESFDKGEI